MAAVSLTSKDMLCSNSIPSHGWLGHGVGSAGFLIHLFLCWCECLYRWLCMCDHIHRGQDILSCYLSRTTHLVLVFDCPVMGRLGWEGEDNVPQGSASVWLLNTGIKSNAYLVFSLEGLGIELHSCACKARIFPHQLHLQLGRDFFWISLFFFLSVQVFRHWQLIQTKCHAS